MKFIIKGKTRGLNKQSQTIILMFCWFICFVAYLALTVVFPGVAIGMILCAFVVVSYKLAETFVD